MTAALLATTSVLYVAVHVARWWAQASLQRHIDQALALLRDVP